jgi:glucosylceramidase
MKLIAFIISVLMLSSCIQQKPQSTGSQGVVNNFTTGGKSVTVVTTADSSNLRLSNTGTLKFGDLGKTIETQVYVFVNPEKTFQTILGFGGALTDAAAETFAKLPGPKQEELLQAYYDP